MIRQKLVVGNWKMNLPALPISTYCMTLAAAVQRGARVMLAPPLPFLSLVQTEIGRSGLVAELAAQNCSSERAGAHTGEVSAEMLVQAGCGGVIVGHSERRQNQRESDAEIRSKAAVAALAGLIPLICVGEDASVRQSGGARHWLERQIGEVWSEELCRAPEVRVAYEPIWAIGTGVNATADMVTESIGWILEALRKTWSLDILPSVGVLYGGSVTPENALELSMCEGVEGFLVGGASLDPGRLAAIVQAAGQAVSPK